MIGQAPLQIDDIRFKTRRQLSATSASYTPIAFSLWRVKLAASCAGAGHVLWKSRLKSR